MTNNTPEITPAARIARALERAEAELPMLAAPDGTVAVQIEDLRAFVTDRQGLRDLLALGQRDWAARWYGSEPMKGSHIHTVTEHGGYGEVVAFVGATEAHHAEADKIVAAHNAFLARHRDTSTTALIEPWKNFDGPLPDYDHVLRPVYESGIQYAVELMAKYLGVEVYDICDGTEEFDGDLGGTMLNIIREVMPADAGGDKMYPSEVRDAFAALEAENLRLRETFGWRSIETAPKDGSTIDVWRDGTRETVYWGFPPHECGEMGQYCDSDWHSLKEPGWICSTFGEFVGGKHDPFTHWKPLDAGPAALTTPSHTDRQHALRKMVALDEELEEQFPGWMDGSHTDSGKGEDIDQLVDAQVASILERPDEEVVSATTPEDIAAIKQGIRSIAERFCATKLPETVAADSCATIPHYASPRYGTHLLTVAEAEQIMEQVFTTPPAREAEKRVIARIVQAAEAIGFQAGVGGRETAGAIVSYLATSPDEIAPFVDGKLSPIDFAGDWMRGGCLSWHAVNGEIVHPAALNPHAD